MTYDKRATIIRQYIEHHDIIPEVFDYAVTVCIVCENTKAIFRKMDEIRRSCQTRHFYLLEQVKLGKELKWINPNKKYMMLVQKFGDAYEVRRFTRSDMAESISVVNISGVFTLILTNPDMGVQ